MSNPEISRRCAACGITVRQQAMFCPQCGSEMPNNKDDEPFDPRKTIAESRDSRANNESAPGKNFDASVTQPLRPSVPPTAPLGKAAKSVDEKAHTIALSSVELPPEPAPVTRAAGAVGKLKRVSTAVLDQAAYDPSARFLLVAAGLFAVFVLLLVLSKVLR